MGLGGQKTWNYTWELAGQDSHNYLSLSRLRKSIFLSNFPSCEGTHRLAGLKEDRFADDLSFCRLLLVAVLLFELTALGRGGAKLGAQVSVGSVPNER